jgi:hypothetical protein
VELTSPPARQGYLLFEVFDQTGRPVKPRGRVLDQGLRDGLSRRLAAITRPWVFGGEPVRLPAGELYPTYQLQFYLEGDDPLTTAERDLVRAFFSEARSRLQRSGPGGRKVNR